MDTLNTLQVEEINPENRAKAEADAADSGDAAVLLLIQGALF